MLNKAEWNNLAKILYIVPIRNIPEAYFKRDTLADSLTDLLPGTRVVPSFAHSPIHTFTHSLALPLTLCHPCSLSVSLGRSVFLSLALALIHSFAHLIAHILTPSFTHSLSHLVTQLHYFISITPIS